MTRPRISILTPCYNEEKTVEICAQTVRKIMETELPDCDYEHIFSDNASTDRTAELLRKLATDDQRVKVIINSRNVGPFRNMFHALKYATGDAVLVMIPADMQDPPELIPQFVKLWREGYRIVYGVRTQREEPFWLRTCRHFYYRLVKVMSGVNIPVDAGEFQLIDRTVADQLKNVDDYYPYIRGLIAKTGMRSIGVPYTWRRRANGVSKNSLISLIDQALNGIVSTSRAPMRICILLGFLLSGLSTLYAIIQIIWTLLFSGAPRGIPTLIVAQFFFNGIMLFFLGVLGEYVLAIHEQIRRGPPMIALEMINFDREETARPRNSDAA
jgi:glycosyltransferase involved in cell wall biosynthesis